MKSNDMFARNKADAPFAQGLCFYKLFWIFVTGCVIGVVIEMLWCYFTLHTLESRKGLIYGPFNPVYGLGAVAITLALYKLAGKRDLWVFACSALAGGIFEYACSLFQETVFGTVSWDYPTTFINLHGRTSILYCMFWGILGLIWIKDAMPRVSSLIERIPRRVGMAVTWLLVVFFLFDIAVSSAAVLRRTERSRGHMADSRLEMFLDSHYTDDFLQQIYPNMIIKSN